MPDNHISTRLRQATAQRAQDRCEYCQSQARFALHPFSVEHIIPRSKGGETTLGNLAFACQGCNNHKYNKIEAPDPISNETVPLYNPRKHKWMDHFAWNEDYSLLIGLTPIGRATIEALQLNREGVVNLRRILYSVGEHPPASTK